MADEARPLSDDERAELEALRAERAAREERERAARERAELEELRAQHQADAASQRQAAAQQVEGRRAKREAAEQEQRIREARERGAKLMEPDDDLRMPMGQKIVIAALVLIVVIWVVMTFLVG